MAAEFRQIFELLKPERIEVELTEELEKR